MSKQEQAVSSVGPWPKLDSAAAAGPHAAISPRTRTTVLQPETGSLTPGRMGQDTGRQEAVRLELAADATAPARLHFKRTYCENEASKTSLVYSTIHHT